jgi:hypothetical protein
VKGARRGADVELRSDPARRAEILALFAKKYADSPWAALAEESE